MRYSNPHRTLVIIPAFNEEKNIGQVIDSLKNNCRDIDILVVNDGSLDNTLEIATGKKVMVINHIFNMGVGASFQTGCLFAVSRRYDYIVRIDGDGQHNAKYINQLITPVRNGDADIVIGSRFLDDSEFTSSFFRLIGISIISFFLTLITRKRITDPTSGFCAMNRRAYEFFSDNCAEDYPEPEILMSCKNFMIREVPVSMGKRTGGVSSITPLKSIYYILKVLLSLFVNIFRKETKCLH